MTQWSFRHSGMMLLLAAVAVWAVAATRHRVAALLLGAVVTAELFLFAPSLTPTTGPLIYTMPAVRAAAVDRSPGARRVYHTRAFDTFAGYAPFSGFGGVDRLHDYMAALKGSDWATPERLLEWASQAAGRRLSTFEDLDACLNTAEGDALISEAAHYERLKEAFSPNAHLLSRVPVVRGFDAVEVRWSARLWQDLRRREDARPCAHAQALRRRHSRRLRRFGAALQRAPRRWRRVAPS